MDVLPPALSRGRQHRRPQNGTNGDAAESDIHTDEAGERSLAGHPCAAGCGHVCWMAVGDRKSTVNVQEPIRG